MQFVEIVEKKSVEQFEIISKNAENAGLSQSLPHVCMAPGAIRIKN